MLGRICYDRISIRGSVTKTVMAAYFSGLMELAIGAGSSALSRLYL